MPIYARKHWVTSYPVWNAAACSCKSQRCSQPKLPLLPFAAAGPFRVPESILASSYRSLGNVSFWPKAALIRRIIRGQQGCRLGWERAPGNWVVVVRSRTCNALQQLVTSINCVFRSLLITCFENRLGEKDFIGNYLLAIEKRIHAACAAPEKSCLLVRDFCNVQSTQQQHTHLGVLPTYQNIA